MPHGQPWTYLQLNFLSLEFLTPIQPRRMLTARNREATLSKPAPWADILWHIVSRPLLWTNIFRHILVHAIVRVAAQTTRDGIRQYSHCEYVLSRSLTHCKNYSFGHVGLLSSLFSITVQELPQKNVYDHIERRFLHMRTIFTDNIRYSLMCCMKALIFFVAKLINGSAPPHGQPWT